MMKFKKCIILVIFMIFVISVSGCSSKKVVKVKKNVQKLTGNVQIWGNPEKQGEIDTFIAEFNKTYPDVQVTYVSANDAALLKEAATGGNSSDLILINDCYISQIASENQGYYRDITKDIADYQDNFSKTKLANISYSDKILAFPYSSTPIAIIYRTDRFSSAGIDPDDIETWYDFAEAGKKIYSSSAQKTKILAIPLSENNNLIDIMLSQLNISYFSEDGNSKLAGDEAQKAVSTLNYLNVDNSIYGVELSKNAIDALNDGSAAAIYGSPETMMTIENKYPGLKNKLKIMKLPSFESGGNHDVAFSGYSVMIKDPLMQNKAALEFAKFISTDDKTQTEVLKSKGSFPANSSCYTDSLFSGTDSFYENERVWQLMLNIDSNAPSITYNQNYQEAQQKTLSALAQIILKKQDIKTVLDNLKIQ